MASAIFAVLRDVAKLAATAADDLAAQATKIAATAADDLASQAVKMAGAADDIATLTGKATAKSASVAGDDLAVGAGQVGTGVSPNRELPALWRIVKGSALNKAGLSVALLVISVYAPLLVTILLCLGALYLAYEGGEGLLEHWHPQGADADSEENLNEDQKVKRAIATDLVLSLEILVIALSAIGDVSLEYKAAVLVVVSVIMTIGVYGLIALIIRLDDMGLALAKTGVEWKRRLGFKMANAAPIILRALEPIGMAAMFAVAGGILVHLVHLEMSHWTLGLLVDTVTGVVVGLLLAGGHHFINRLRNKQDRKSVV